MASAQTESASAAAAAFVGRRNELAQLREEAGRARVLAVAGRPGSGRTELALRLAREPDVTAGRPVHYLSLAAPDPARRLLDLLGLPRPAALAATDAEAAAGDALRAHLAAEPVVLVLDDVPAENAAAAVQALLPTHPEALTVAVTHGPLTGIPDVRPCVLGGLDYTAARDLLAGLAGDTRVVVDPVAAQGLAEAVACHAGALRLVGGWLAARPRASVSDALRALRAVPALPAVPEVPVFSTVPHPAGPPVPEAAQNLVGQTIDGQRVPPMPAYPPSVTPPPPPRGAQRTEDPLRRAFDLVHQELGAGPRQLLRFATLVPGGVLDERGAAALVGCPTDAAATLLASLAAQQLLREEPGGRYRLPRSLAPALTALREAVDKPATVELARARWLERQVRLLTSCLVRLAPEQAPPDPEVPPAALRFRTRAQAFAWLDTALPELLPAVADAEAVGGLDGLVTRLATALVQVLPVWGEATGRPVTTELYTLHGTVQRLARRSGLPRREAAALVNLGDLHAGAGEHARALERYRGALAPARAAEDHVAVGRILEATAGAYRASGDLVRAVDFYGRALTLRRNRKERADEARLLARLAAVHSAQGRHADALREYRAAVALHRKLGDEAGAVGAILGAARVQELGGGVEAALRTQREALESARRLGPQLTSLVLLRLADTLERAGDLAGARVQREQAAALGGE
ncbi:tetratricopeptide repeat protein [Streptacidiphilus anmyonensis]|uniref:tetratricopeptide repeat protein n=1 Tax=Streptacidiphilus anmyonensis TaxID=405782 RepID=UPI0007C79CC2|nr:tetratricopeptide repeat protein [Streptacidiphilus anmyonensis]